MAIQNAYNPNPSTVDSLLRQRQTRVDLGREQGLMEPAAPAPKAQENPKYFGVEQTPDYEDKSFGRKVGEDAALLAYAIPVGLAKIATGLVSHPIETIKEVGGAFKQSVKDAVDVDYYKAHPLLGVVNLAGFVAPVAGIAKSTALKTAMRTSIDSGIKEAVTLGVDEAIVRSALTTGMKDTKGFLLKKGALGNAVWEASRTGKMELVTETVKSLLSKAGIADDVALRVGTQITDKLYTDFSRNTTKMKALESIAHPVGSALRLIVGKTDPLRKALFGTPAESAVAKLYGADTVAKNPEGFVAIERWAGAQVKERGFENTVANRQRIMQEWVEQNSQWASLTPEERILHFKNYAEQDLVRKQLHDNTGMDIVTVKALPQNYVDAMVQTIKDSPEVEVSKLTQMLDDNFGRDYSIHSDELSKAATKEDLISAVSKLGDSRSAISFTKFSPEVQNLASQLEKSGYRVGYAPKNKEVSFVTDTFAGGSKANGGVEYFRGVGKDGRGQGYSQLGKGKYVSSDKSVADYYARNGGTIEKFNLPKDIKFIKQDSPEFIELYNQLAKDGQGDLTTRLTDELKRRGYDGVDGTIRGEGQFAPERSQTVIFDEAKLTPIIDKSGISTNSVFSKRTALGNWIERMGLSPEGTIEGAVEFSYRENFTQRALSQFPETLKVGGVTVPTAKLFEWIDRNKALMQQSRPKLTLPLRTVFDVKADDLVRAGFSAEDAAKIESISKAALREVPASITGMGDALINYIRTFDKGFGGWVSKWYDNYLKAAYKGRYDWSPFFSAQQFVETKLQSAMFLKDVRMIPGGKGLEKLGNWTAEKLAKRVEGTAPYLKKIVEEPPLEQVAAVREEILGTLQKTMLDYTSSPDIIGIQNAAKGSYALLKDKAAFEQSIRSRNFWYAVTGQSSVRMATTFNKALAEKFGMGLDDALAFTYENGVKKYKNPQMVQMMREATQAVFHYAPGITTSPLMKTLNIAFFPLRFQTKTVQLTANWLKTLSPASRLVFMNNWVSFANWAGSDEGIEWRRTNRNVLYNIFAYTTAYEQMGQGLDAVTKGRLFGGNAGLIGGVPFGFMVNLARELAILPEDPDQFDPKTGKQFTKQTPRKFVSTASLAVALEQLLISISPSTPFYSLTGGVIGGVSPRKWIESLVRQTVGATEQALKDRDPSKGRQMLERDFKRVPLDYTRLSQ